MISSLHAFRARGVVRILVTAVAAALACAATAQARPVRIKLATLAPSGTSFHLTLQEMAAKWKAAPDGGVPLTIFPDGRMGGESDMVRRMRTNQLQAGLLTVSGISDIEFAVAGLQNMPMAFRSLEEAAWVRERLQPTYEKALAEKGFIVLGWFDSGWVQVFSKNPIETPEQMKGEKVFVLASSPASAEIARSFGMTPVPLEPTDILLSLQTGQISAVTAPPFYALASQFHRTAPHMLEINWSPLVGGLVVTRAAWEQLSPGQQQVLRTSGAEACAKILVAARKEMADSVEAMRAQGMSVHSIGGEHEEEWRAFAETILPKTRGTIVPEQAWDEIMGLIKEYRAR